MATWNHDDINDFIDYYKVHHYDPVTAWEKEYNNPTQGQMVYLILDSMGIGRDYILRILGIGESSLRSIKARLNARKNKNK